VEPAGLGTDVTSSLLSGSPAHLPPSEQETALRKENERLLSEIASLRQSLDATNTENVTLKVQLATQIDANSELRLQAAELGARLANQVSASEALQQRCTELQDTITQQNAREAGLRASLASMAAQGADEEGAVQSLREASAMMETRIQQLQKALQDKDAEISAAKDALQKALEREADQAARAQFARSRALAQQNNTHPKESSGFHLGATQTAPRPGRTLTASSMGPDADPEEYLSSNAYDFVEKIGLARRALLSILSAGITLGIGPAHLSESLEGPDGAPGSL